MLRYSPLVLAATLLIQTLSVADVTFRVADVTVDPGGTGTASVVMDATEVVAGFAYGLCPSEYSVISIQSAEPGSALAPFGSGSGPDFFQAELAPMPELIVGSHSVGCVLDFSGIEVLGPFDDQELVAVEFAVLESETIELNFCDILGFPDVSTIYVTSGGASVAPEMIGGTVSLDPGFVRGDCNDDGLYDIGDGIAALDLLFAGGSVPCDSACDANDDGNLDVGDGIFVLSSLFAGGPDPSAPVACGSDPTPDSLDCDSYSSCP